MELYQLTPVEAVPSKVPQMARLEAVRRGTHTVSHDTDARCWLRVVIDGDFRQNDEHQEQLDSLYSSSIIEQQQHEVRLRHTARMVCEIAVHQLTPTKSQPRIPVYI